MNHGNRSLAVALWPKGKLVGGRLRDGSRYADIKPDGSIVAKLGWWRAVEGPLGIEGERLDGRSAPLRADVPGGYDPTGFQASLLTFPTPGCWKVVGSIGRMNLTFVVLVRKRRLPSEFITPLCDIRATTAACACREQWGRPPGASTSVPPIVEAALLRVTTFRT